MTSPRETVNWEDQAYRPDVDRPVPPSDLPELAPGPILPYPFSRCSISRYVKALPPAVPPLTTFKAVPALLVGFLAVTTSAAVIPLEERATCVYTCGSVCYWQSDITDALNKGYSLEKSGGNVSKCSIRQTRPAQVQ